MSEKQIFWKLALELLTVVGAWFVLDRAVLYGGKLLLRLLKPRCSHTWVAGDFYQEIELHGQCGTVVHMGQFKCICETCKAGKLQEAAVRAKPDGSGEILFISNGKVTQITQVPVLRVNKQDYPK